MNWIVSVQEMLTGMMMVEALDGGAVYAILRYEGSTVVSVA